MASVARLCGMTHSVIGTILKTLNQAVSEMQRLGHRQHSSENKDDDSQNSRKCEHGVTGSASKWKLTGFMEIRKTLGVCVLRWGSEFAPRQGCVHRLEAHLNLSNIDALAYSDETELISSRPDHSRSSLTQRFFYMDETGLF